MVGQLTPLALQELALNLYKMLVLPLHDYTDVVYDCISVKDYHNLQKLQNYSMKVILQSGYDIRLWHNPWWEAHEIRPGLAEWQETHAHIGLCLHVCQWSRKVSSQLVTVTDTLATNTRDAECQDLVLPNYHLDMLCRAFRYRGPFYWNLTDLSIRNTPSLPCFKNALKQSDMFG